MSGLRRRVLCASAILVLAAAVPARGEEVKEAYRVFGVLLDITVDSPDTATGQDRIRDAIAVARRLEGELAAVDANSDLSRLNAGAGLGPVPVSLDLYRLLAFSQLMTRSTGGAFDVTVGPLLKLHAGSTRTRESRPVEDGGARPDERREARFDEDEALSLVGWEKIVLHPPDRVELADAGMSVDCSGVVKGYVLERMAASLRAGGVVKALLEFGDANVLAIGPPEGEPPFRVWVARGKSMAGSVALRDRSLSTSRARHRGDDALRAPIVDPRSGRFVEADRQATVLARDGAIADAWSTALVVDPDGALGLLEEPRDVEALVFDEHGEHSSPRFASEAGWKPGRKSSGSVDEIRSDPQPGASAVERRP